MFFQNRTVNISKTKNKERHKNNGHGICIETQPHENRAHDKKQGISFAPFNEEQEAERENGGKGGGLDADAAEVRVPRGYGDQKSGRETHGAVAEKLHAQKICDEYQQGSKNRGWQPRGRGRHAESGDGRGAWIKVHGMLGVPGGLRIQGKPRAFFVAAGHVQNVRGHGDGRFIDLHTGGNAAQAREAQRATENKDQNN